MVLNQKSARKLLEENGWTMTKPGERPITLPHHKKRDHPPGLTNAIVRQAGLK